MIENVNDSNEIKTYAIGSLSVDGVKVTEIIFSNTVRHDPFYQIVTTENVLIAPSSGPIVRFMADNINKVNGHVSKDTIHCVRCVGNLTGGFIPEDGSIILCQNKLRNQGHAEDSMAHEMVHAYDRLRFKTDWKDMRHLACTEVFHFLPHLQIIMGPDD